MPGRKKKKKKKKKKSLNKDLNARDFVAFEESCCRSGSAKMGGKGCVVSECRVGWIRDGEFCAPR